MSVHALNPLYVDVLDLPGADTVAAQVDRLRAELDEQETIDYPAVMAAKWKLLRQLHEGAPPDPAVSTTARWPSTRGSSTTCAANWTPRPPTPGAGAWR